MTAENISPRRSGLLQKALRVSLCAEGFLFLLSKKMIIPTRRAIAIVLGVTFFVGQVGCAHPLYLPEDIRAQLGTIGVVSPRFAPEVTLDMPAKGAGGGAGRGAAEGAAGAFGVPAEVGCSGVDWEPCALGLALGLALAVPGAIVGGVYGAIAAEPAESVEEVEARIRQVLAELKMQEALRDHVLQEARNQTRYTFILLTEEGPTEPGEEITYRAVRSEGVDMILEVSVQSVGFKGKWAINPPIAFSMTAHVRLIEVGDGTVHWDRSSPYTTSARPYTEWTVNDAQAFREALDSGYERLAEKIVDALFLYTPLPGHEDIPWWLRL